MVSNRIRNSRHKPQPGQPGQPAPDRAKIIVVEDDAEIANCLSRQAREYFAQPVLLAGSLAEAHAALDRSAPQIVFLDLLLPDGDGADLLLRLERDQVPAVAVITAQPNLNRATLALRAGAADFLAKPFTAEQLNATFERLARRLTDRQSHSRLAEHAAAADQANQQLRLKIDILCKDLVGGYQKLVSRMTGP